jgi:hypothetical protein
MLDQFESLTRILPNATTVGVALHHIVDATIHVV